MTLSWGGIARLGLVQMALGSVVVLVTSTLNRVMVVEFALPAILPGALVALHYGVQVLRPRMGWGSDMGGRRTPWIVGGIAAMAAGALVAALGACLMPASLAAGLALATAGFVALGLGVGAAGTSLLTLVAHRVDPNRRAASATILWLMMIAGIAVTAGVASRLLDPFSPARLLEITAGVGAVAMVLTLLAVWRVEGPAAAPAPAARAPFLPALKEIWRERQSRRFAQFVFVSMLAYSAQELLLEPFAGAVFGLTPGQTAGLTGLQHGGVLAGMALVAVATVWAGAYRGRVMRAWTMGGCAASAVGILLLALAAVVPALPLRPVVFALGMANGAFAVSAIGAMLGLAAEGRGSRDGTRIGLWGAAQALAFGAGGLLGTGASDIAHRLVDTPALAYGAVFVAEAATFLLAARLAAGLFGDARPADATITPPRIGSHGMTEQTYDAVVVGGGPAGATAAADLANNGRTVLLLDKAGRIKPCGGAVPPILIRDFAIPDHLMVARAQGARIVAPSAAEADMPINDGVGGGYVGMVDRETFDEWLRERAATAGAERRDASFERVTRDPDGVARIHFTPKGAAAETSVRTRAIIGADGAKSNVARQCVPGADHVKYVFAYHEIVRAPAASPGYDPTRCDIYYQGPLSPDFYAWVFPHGETMSIGTGSAQKGFGLRPAVAKLRAQAGLAGLETIRREGAPIPLRPMKRWDNGRDIVLAGDAAGVVAPASGEGIYYAMLGGRLAADAVELLCKTGEAKSLRTARKRFMRAHGRIFMVLGFMQWFWYSNDKRRETFVKMCRDKDVQRLTWDSYMNKKIAKRDPMAHVRVFFKDLGQLFGMARSQA